MRASRAQTKEAKRYGGVVWNAIFSDLDDTLRLAREKVVSKVVVVPTVPRKAEPRGPLSVLEGSQA